jgi:tetratricopeptide (TPR) repeat protein
MLALSLLLLATAAAYRNSFNAPFLLDDVPSISTNLAIHNLSNLGDVLNPAAKGLTTSGRPLLSLSLALNYAVSGECVWSYHVVNLLIHILGVFTLFGVVRQTFLLPSLRDRWEAVATPLACVIALLWAVHPLLTESVTYIVQRAESLVGMFYLLTLYCVIRGANSNQAVLWYVLATLACILGVGCKEIMVSAPLIVLLYDRAFLSGSFREALRRRWGLYLSLACTWLLLGWLIYATGNRGGTAGFDAGVNRWGYLYIQFYGIAHYLWLCVWPRSLVFDYGELTLRWSMQVVPYAALVVFLLAATLVALWRWPKIGFLGAWFFAILAPTSSFVPVATQTLAEHRMYLPSAAVLVLLVLGVIGLGQWLKRRLGLPAATLNAIGYGLAIAIAIVLAVVTYQRNNVYASALSIWKDTTEKVEYNGRAHNGYGRELADEDRFDEAIVEYRLALEHHGRPEDVYPNLGVALLRAGKVDEAIDICRKAVELAPEIALAYSNLGNALRDKGQFDEAIEQYEKALDRDPSLDLVHNNLGGILANQSKFDLAVLHFEKALEINPEFSDAKNNLSQIYAIRGQLLGMSGQYDDAILEFKKSLAMNPEDKRASQGIGIATAELEKAAAFLDKQRKLAREDSSNVAVLNNTAWILATNPNASLRNGAEAVRLAQHAVDLPGGKQPDVLGTLAAAYAEAGRFSDAVQTAKEALELATQQNKTGTINSLNAKLPLYEAVKPYR